MKLRNSSTPAKNAIKVFFKYIYNISLIFRYVYIISLFYFLYYICRSQGRRRRSREVRELECQKADQREVALPAVRKEVQGGGVCAQTHPEQAR